MSQGDQPIWLDVLPSLAGFGDALTKGTRKAADDAGKYSGSAWAKSFDTSAGDSATKTRVAELEKASKTASRAIDTETQNIGKARATQRDAAARVVEAEAKLTAARDSGDSAKVAAAELRLEAARERSDSAAKKVASTEGALRAAHREQKTATEQLEAAQGDLNEENKRGEGIWARLTSNVDDADKSARGASGGFGELVGKLTAVVAAGALVSAGFAGAMDLEDGTAKMTAALNLTASEAALAGDVAGSLYSQAYGESMSDVTGAVESVLGSIKGLGDQSPEVIESVAAAAMNLEKVFGVDVSEAAAAAGIAISNGLAKDGTHAMDLMTSALQQVPEAMRGEVIDAANEYGGVMVGLGFTGEQAFGMLAKASDGGSIAIDKVGDALKEFTIRGTNLSKTSVAAYEAIGLNASDMSNSLLAGGEQAASATQQIVDGLLGIKDPAAQANAAIALFGPPLEDLGVTEIPSFLEGLSAMDTSLGDVSGKAGEVADTMGGTTSASLETFKRGFMGVLTEGIEPLLGPAQSFLDWISEITPGIQDVISILFSGDYTGGLSESFGLAKDSGFVDFLFDVREGIVSFGDYITETAIPALEEFGGWVVENKDWLLAVGVAVGTVTVAIGLWRAATIVGAAAQAAFNVVMNANPIMLVVTAVGALVAGLVYFFTQTETGKAAWETFTTAIGSAWETVRGALETGWNWMDDNVIQPIGSAIGWVGEQFVKGKDLAVSAWDLLSAGLKKGADWVNQWVIQPYLSYVQWVWDKVVAVKDGVVGAWNLMRDGLKAGGDWIATNVFDPLKSAVSAVGTAFDATKDFIGTAWSKIKEAAAKPVNFIIETVYTNGIKKTWDSITSAVGLKLDLPKVSPIAFADGGVMPGYTPGRDIHRFVSPTGGVLDLSGGEPILRPEVGRVLGTGWVHGVNAAARNGGVGGVQSFLGGQHQAFAGGGFWNWAGGVVSGAGRWIKDAALDVAGFLADPVSGIKDLISAPMESLLSTVASGTLGEALVELPRKSIEGLIDKARDLLTGRSGDSSVLEGLTAGAGGALAAVGGWNRPSRGPVTSRFGARWGAFHNGIDIAGGGPTYAVWPGRVAKTGWGVGYGNTGIGILIDHSNGLQSYYGHNPVGGVKVSPGQLVAGGQHVGAQGATGNVTGIHLHHSIFRNGKALDPASYGVFDQGGRFEPNAMALNLSGKPEAILNNQQWDDIHQLALANPGESSINVYITVTGEASGAEVFEAFDRELRKQRRGGVHV